MSNETTTTPAPVSWFEIGTPNPDGARHFYREMFGWNYEVEGTYSIVDTGDGAPIKGGIQDTRESSEGTPLTYAIPCVQVSNVAGSCAQAETLGGKVLVPATEMETGLVYAHMVDPDGNHLGLWSPPAA